MATPTRNTRPIATSTSRPAGGGTGVRVGGADGGPGGVDDAARMQVDARLEEGAPATGRADEADVLAVGLGRGTQAPLGGDGAHVGLRKLADREAHARQARLVEHRDHI